MADLDAKFEAAAADVKKFTKKPTDEELLELYGLYKQVTVGDNNTSQPWAVQMEARAKWEAWEKNKGVDKKAAQQKYIDVANKLKQTYA